MRTTEFAVATEASCYLGLDVLAAGMGILAENAEDATWLQRFERGCISRS